MDLLFIGFQVASLTYEWVQLYNTSLTCITIVYTTMKELLKGDFGVNNFARPGIRTRDLPTHFFFVATAPSIIEGLGLLLIPHGRALSSSQYSGGPSCSCTFTSCLDVKTVLYLARG